MILGKHSHEPALHIDDSVIEISGCLSILGVRIDVKLSFKDHLINCFMEGLCQGSSSETT